MLRDIDLSKISDGKLYTGSDMVKTDCRGCTGCFECCQGMGTSIILDPLDVFRLTVHLSKSFEQLLADTLELNVVDGIVLPNLKMAGEDEHCIFLGKDGRWAVITKIILSGTFCRYTNVPSLIRQKSRLKNGWMWKISGNMKNSRPTGTTT